MVIGREFAWAHLPKAAGTATLAMFELFPALIVCADPADSAGQHATFADRAARVEGKLLALNFRRLPAWVLSRAHQVALRGLEPDYRPAPMQSPHVLARSSLPDHRLALFTGGDTARVDRWLRVEQLADDFLALVGELHDVTESDRRLVHAVPQTNSIGYDHDIAHWFSPAQVRTMYEHNPVWAELEARLYGDVALA
jgi:hypothetical protein